MVVVIGDPPCFFSCHSTSFLSTKYILLFLVDTNLCSTKFFSKIVFVAARFFS